MGTPFGHKAMNMIKPDGALLRTAVDELVASGFRDPEGLFYQIIHLAHAGELDRAVEILADVVNRGSIRTTRSRATRGSIRCARVRTSTPFWRKPSFATRRPAWRL